MLSKYIIDCETDTLSETVMTDKRILDVYSDDNEVIKLQYQSIYLHLKALSKYYLIKGNTTTSRRIMSMASELASVLNQMREVKFRK